MHQIPRRYDIYLAELKEIDSVCGYRPIVIIQNDKGNTYSSTVIAALITSRDKKNMPTHVSLGERYGLKKPSTILCEHIITVDKSLLRKHIGTIVNSPAQRQLDAALRLSLSL